MSFCTEHGNHTAPGFQTDTPVHSAECASFLVHSNPRRDVLAFLYIFILTGSSKKTIPEDTLVFHYNYVVMSTMASQFNGVLVVHSTVCSGEDKKKTSKLRVTGLWEGNSPVTGEFPAQRASNAENVSILWRHHVAPNYARILAGAALRRKTFIFITVYMDPPIEHMP